MTNPTTIARSLSEATIIPASIDRGTEGPALTVAELRTFLDCLPDDAPVLIWRRDSPGDDEDYSCSGWAVTRAKIAQSTPIGLESVWDTDIFDTKLPMSAPVLVLADMDEAIPSWDIVEYSGDGVSYFSSTKRAAILAEQDKSSGS